MSQVTMVGIVWLLMAREQATHKQGCPIIYELLGLPPLPPCAGSGIIAGWAQPASSFHPWHCDHCRPCPAQPWYAYRNLELQGNLAVRSCGGEQWFSEAPNSLSCGSVFSLSTPLLDYRGLLQEGRVLKLQRKTYCCGDKEVPQLLIEHHVFSGSFWRKSAWEIPRIERLKLGERYQQLKIRLHNSKSEDIFSCICCYLHSLLKQEPVSSLLCFWWVHVRCLWTSSAGRVKYICLWNSCSTEHHNISDQEMKTEELIKCIFRVNFK